NHYEAVNVEAQQENLHSFLWWMKRLIALRRRFQAFGKGTIEFLYPKNRRVLVFIRRFGDEIILVVANLSRFVQFAELDLSAFKGSVPVELFGQTKFPTIGDLPYFITVGPHGFYWFRLEQPHATAAEPAGVESETPLLKVTGSWENLFARNAKANLERILPRYLNTCRWFGGKARHFRSVEIVEAIPLPFNSATAYLIAVKVQYAEGHPETYLLPLAFAPEERMVELRQSNPNLLIAQLLVKDKGQEFKGALYDAFHESGFCRSLVDAIARRRRFKGDSAEILATPSKVFRDIRGSLETPLEPFLVGREQSNTSVVYGDRFILKMFRRLQEGLNPDLEIGRFLTERISFNHVPPLAGALEFYRSKSEPITIGILQGLVPNEGDAWQYTLDNLTHYFDDSVARKADTATLGSANDHILDMVDKEMPPLAREVMGPYLASASLLGQRTGELHVALASDTSDPSFAPESFTALYRRSLYQSMRTFADKTLALLADRLQDLPETLRSPAKELLGVKSRIFNCLRRLLDIKMSGMRLRVHGDYHLGQVLYTGKDFFIIDFEGEPARPIGERRMKRSPLKDVAGMLRSFDYASAVALRNRGLRPEDMPHLELWGRFWGVWVCVAFLKSYLDVTASAGFLPKSREEMKVLLDLHVLEKAIYELNYELNNRPDWVSVPIRGIMEILQRA
ncbi:MAG TPA: putative maltokinase, partial [Candidatus Binatia bacterium]|nr:putative maltokinase [Candidatus Binatia bacterium]